jgi:hypothetical protein
MIVNKTARPIAIHLDHSYLAVSSCVISPDRAFGIPAELAEAGGFCIAADQTSHRLVSPVYRCRDWSSRSVQHLAVKQTVKVFKDDAEDKVALGVRAVCRQEVADLPDGTPVEMFTVYLHAFVVVYNLLPHDVQLSMLDGEASASEVLEVIPISAKSGKVSLVHTDHGGRVHCRLSHAVYQSEPCTLYTKENGHNMAKRHIVMKSATAKELQVILEWQSRPNGKACLFVYCEYSALNLSGYDLAILLTVPGADSSHVLPLALPAISNQLDSLESSVLLPAPHTGSFKAKFGATNVQLGVCAAGPWSQSLSLDAVGMLGGVHLPHAVSGLDIGVLIQMGDDKYSLTKLIKFQQRFIMVNLCDQPVHVCQDVDDEGAIGQHVVTITVNERVGWHFEREVKRKKEGRIRIRLSKFEWSASCVISEPTELCVPLRESGSTQDAPQYSRLGINVVEREASLFVVFTQSPNEPPPYQIVNCTSLCVSFRQADQPSDLGQTVGSFAESGFAWLDPMVTKRRLVLEFAGCQKHVNPDKLKAHKPISVGGSSLRIYITITMTGPSKVVSLDEEPDDLTAAQSFKHDLVFRPTVRVKLQLSAIGISLVDAKPEEVLYATIGGIDVETVYGSEQHTISAKIDTIQIDNQLRLAMFPVVLAPVPSRSKTPVFQFVMIRNFGASLEVVPYVALLIQELSLELDVLLISRLVLTVRRIVMTMPKPPPSNTSPEEESIGPHFGNKMYLQFVQLHPIKVTVTIDTADASRQDTFGIVGALLPRVDHAPLRLNALVFEHVFQYQEQLLNKLTKHYTRYGSISTLYAHRYKARLCGADRGYSSSIECWARST